LIGCQLIGEQFASLSNIRPLLVGGYSVRVGQRYPEADDASGAGVSGVRGKVRGVGRAG